MRTKSLPQIAGELSFTNNGSSGHNAIIRDVSATIRVGQKTIEEDWLSFAKVTRADTKLLFDINEAAHPVVIEGGSAASYMVTFSPRVRDCPQIVQKGADCDQTQDFVSDIDFIKVLLGSTELVVTFTGRLFNSRGNKLTTSCKTLITSDEIKTIAMNSWYASRCTSLP